MSIRPSGLFALAWASFWLAACSNGDGDTIWVPVNHAPHNHLQASVATDEDTPLRFAGPAAIIVGDDDTPTITVTLVATRGALNLTAMKGTLFDLNVALSALTFTPDPDYFGPATITLISDDGELQETSTVDIAIESVNDPPVVVVPDAIPGLINTVTDLTVAPSLVLVSDVDAGAAAMAYTITAAHGLVTTIAGSGATLSGSASLDYLNTLLATLTFKPDDDYLGPATIAIAVNDNGSSGDGGAQTAEGVVTINYQKSGTPPVATDDTYATAGNTAILPGSVPSLIANDSDVHGPITLVTTGTITTKLQGTVTIADDGTFTYVPPIGVGSTIDSFTYTIAGVYEDTATASVSIALRQVIWYVTPSATGNGASMTPVGSLVDAAEVASRGEIVYLYGDAFPSDLRTCTIRAGVRLTGAGVALNVAPNVSIPAAPLAPALVDVGTITLSDDVDVSGLHVRSASAAVPAFHYGGGTSGRISIHDLEIDGYSPSILIDHFVDARLTNVTMSNSGSDGLRVSSLAANTALSLTNVVTHANHGDGTHVGLAQGSMNVTAQRLSSTGDWHASFSLITTATASARLEISDSSFGGVAAGDAGAYGVLITGGGSGPFLFAIERSTFSGYTMGKLHVGAVTQMIGKIANNTFAAGAAATNLDVDIETPTVGNPDVDVTLIANAFQSNAAFARLAVVVGTQGTTCIAPEDNTFTSTSTPDFVADSEGGAVELQGYDGVSDLKTYLNATLGNSVNSVDVRTTVTGGSCAQLPFE